MPVVYYAYYSPVSKSIPAVSRQEHLLGRLLLKTGLEHLYHVSLTLEALDSAIGTGRNGKPHLINYSDIYFNISHCDGLAACAFHSRPVGLDTELPGYFAPVLIQKTLSPEEKSFLKQAGTSPYLEQFWFYRFWTLKEAYVKQSGTGVDTDLTGFSFYFSDTAPSEDSTFSVRCSDSEMRCYQTQLARGQILSLCYPGIKEDVLLQECFQ